MSKRERISLEQSFSWTRYARRKIILTCQKIGSASLRKNLLGAARHLDPSYPCEEPRSDTSSMKESEVGMPGALELAREVVNDMLRPPGDGDKYCGRFRVLGRSVSRLSWPVFRTPTPLSGVPHKLCQSRPRKQCRNIARVWRPHVLSQKEVTALEKNVRRDVQRAFRNPKRPHLGSESQEG
jgi:hypothetical protein